MTPTLLTEWSRLLLGTLARAGVEQVVLSPGSRSTPFAWAALNEPKLRCHSVWDERVAAFFALGQARVSGRPSLLLCTSGTAAANYYPALIEASLARLPVLVLTADRPFELSHASAPQAIDQTKLFGDSVRAFFELGMPDAAESALEGVVRSVAHAVHAAQNGNPGPIHLNARARKPLEPVHVENALSLALHERVDGLLTRGPAAVTRATLHADVTRLARACADTARGVILVGPEPAHRPEAARAVARLAEVTGYPLLCEATSQLRFLPELAPGVLCIDAFEWLLRSPRLRERLSPDLLLSFGGTPTSGGYERWLSRGFDGQRFVVAEHGFPDPHGLATELVYSGTTAAANDTVRHLQHARLQHEGERERFRHAWREANSQAWVAVEKELARPSPLLSEACAVRTVLDHLPDPCQLVIGNSLPIREIDAYVPSAKRALSVLCQRGANGIDGLISGAAGAASLRSEPTVLLLGDVSFMHDLGGLAVAREAAGPFVIVVIDNGGGRIFEQLPIFEQLEQRADASRFWLTPPSAELSHAAGLFGYRFAKLSERASIAGALREALSLPGVSVLQIVVDGSSPRASDQRVRAELESITGACE
ncbi:MAG TPA: 2-succinyl-5-enolpyruvyl-6-hydroxy-3-cyclohexene-1-carboxylic-acid synthase [Polyangiaceae bacterium]|nr:2-succinyl-5-enolpyruvyl-6-hydroxy-3-cyclohexene-1-carboxylic-acid synthase [Polyangiaceae bacterium]